MNRTLFIHQNLKQATTAIAIMLMAASRIFAVSLNAEVQGESATIEGESS